MENKTTLIVEDDGVLAVQLRNMLIELGYNMLEPVATLMKIAIYLASWDRRTPVRLLYSLINRAEEFFRDNTIFPKATHSNSSINTWQ